jgi:hypothetical protein
MLSRILFTSTFIFFAIATSGATTSAQTSGTPLQFNFDFRNGSQGWQADFADYSTRTNIETFEFQSGMRSLPPEIDANGTGFYIQGHNRSDDLFMFLKRRLSSADGIVANQRYQLYFTITFASNAQSNCAGIGGAPGESVALKAGASSIEPLPVLRNNFYFMNIDKGNQGSGGINASVVGNIANGQPCDPRQNPYISVQRTHQHTAEITADPNGDLWLLVGTDSGFEGLTTLYYQRIEVRLVPVGTPSPALTLLSDDDTSHALALDSVTMIRDPFPGVARHNFSADGRTRIMLFARNLRLQPGDDARIVTAQAEIDGYGVYPLEVEFVGAVPDLDWLTQINVKLPHELASSVVRLSITVRGEQSNRVWIRIR